MSEKLFFFFCYCIVIFYGNFFNEQEVKSILKGEMRNIVQYCKVKVIIVNVNFCGYLKSFFNWCILFGLMKKVYEVVIVLCVIKELLFQYYGLVLWLVFDLFFFFLIVLKRNILEVSEYVY